MLSSPASAAIASRLRANVKLVSPMCPVRSAWIPWLVDHLGQAQNGIGAIELARDHAILDLLQVALGGAEQLLAPVRAGDHAHFWAA